MRYIIAAILFIHACGTKAKKIDEDSNCGPDHGDAYLKSEDNDSNKYTLKHVGTDDYLLDYKATTPSAFSWQIKEDNLVLGPSLTYGLYYSEANQTWDIKDTEEKLKGSLIPFRTEKCAALQKMDLEMTEPTETATLFISYPKM